MPSPQSVFITGASSGLGRGLALHYARAGATVHAAARRSEELEKLAADAEGGQGRVVPVALDVGDCDALVAALRTAEQQSGGALDLVIANAGVGRPTPAKKIDWRDVRQTMDVNVTAATVTVAAALPAMVERGRGHVVAMASLAAFRGMPGSAAYCASKAALHVFMESIRVDLRGSGVRATCIYPGFVKTEMTAKNRFGMPFLMELDDAVQVMAKGLAAGNPVIAYPLPMVAMVKTLHLLPRALYEAMSGRMRRA